MDLRIRLKYDPSCFFKGYKPSIMPRIIKKSILHLEKRGLVIDDYAKDGGPEVV